MANKTCFIIMSTLWRIKHLIASRFRPRKGDYLMRIASLTVKIALDLQEGSYVDTDSWAYYEKKSTVGKEFSLRQQDYLQRMIDRYGLRLPVSFQISGICRIVPIPTDPVLLSISVTMVFPSGRSKEICTCCRDLGLDSTNPETFRAIQIETLERELKYLNFPPMEKFDFYFGLLERSSGRRFVENLDSV